MKKSVSDRTVPQKFEWQKNMLVAKNQDKVLKIWSLIAGSIDIKDIDMKWKFNRYAFRYIQTSMRCEISILTEDENLTGRVSFLQFELVCVKMVAIPKKYMLVIE